MGNEKKAEQLLGEFGRKLAQINLPPLRAGENMELRLTVPSLETMGHDFNRQLLSSAQLKFGSKQNNITLYRSGDTVNLKIVKRF